MPAFNLNNLNYYKTTHTSLSDFKGNWLVLDFWISSCTSCIRSFPKVNAIHKKFKNQLTWIMIGVNDNKHNKNIQNVYEKFRNKYQLEMPIAYDSALAKAWNINSMPHIIIVNPAGLVYSITGGRDLSEEKIQDMIDGKEVSFFPKNNSSVDFDANKVSGNISYSANDLLYRSVLMKWNGETQYGGYDIDRYINEKKYLREGYNFAMVPLYALYNYAYIGRWQWDFEHASLYGKVYPKPLLQVKDSSLFQFDYNNDVGKGTYNYNLTIPASEVSKDRIMKLMQEDLKRVFKFNVSLETRKLPVLKLVADYSAVKALQSKGGKEYYSPGTHIAGYTFINVPVRYLVGSLGFYLSDHNTPLIDETGITGNIDFKIEADMTNLEEIRMALRKQGLDLIWSEKEMKVLVISDTF
jgi:thiol-disulfide isomerase/thioredoxin